MFSARVFAQEAGPAAAPFAGGPAAPGAGQGAAAGGGSSAAAESAGSAGSEVDAPEGVAGPEPEAGMGAFRRYFTAPVQSRRHEPLRRVDVRLFAVNAGVANDFAGIADVFQKTIRINSADVASRADSSGIRLNADARFVSSLDFNKEGSGFGVFTGADGRVDLAVSRDLLQVIARGNAEFPVVEGSIEIAGAVFAEVGFHQYFQVQKWRVDIRPSWFLPVLYIPVSQVAATANTMESITVSAQGEVAAYIPVNLDKSGPAMLSNYGGIDFSATVEYALFPILDVGFGVTHIPFMPSRLSHKVRFPIDHTLLDNASVFGIIDDPGILNLDFASDYETEDADFYVTRPFGVNAWFLFRPLRSDLLAVKPVIGITTNTPSEKTFFNAMLELELNVSRVFFVRLTSGLGDGLWRHGAGLSVNLRVIQLDIDAASASQAYIPSWKGNGISLGIGLRAGL